MGVVSWLIGGKKTRGRQSLSSERLSPVALDILAGVFRLGVAVALFEAVSRFVDSGWGAKNEDVIATVAMWIAERKLKDIRDELKNRVPEDKVELVYWRAVEELKNVRSNAIIILDDIIDVAYRGISVLENDKFTSGCTEIPSIDISFLDRAVELALHPERADEEFREKLRGFIESVDRCYETIFMNMYKTVIASS